MFVSHQIIEDGDGGEGYTEWMQLWNDVRRGWEGHGQ